MSTYGRDQRVLSVSSLTENPDYEYSYDDTPYAGRMLQLPSMSSSQSSFAPSPVTPQSDAAGSPQQSKEQSPTAVSPTGEAPRPPKRKRCMPDKGLTSEMMEKKKYPCRFADKYNCNARFTTSGHASRHAKSHANEKSVLCTVEGCGKKFTRTDNMKQHRKTHFKTPSGNTSRDKVTRRACPKTPALSSPHTPPVVPRESPFFSVVDYHTPAAQPGSSSPQQSPTYGLDMLVAVANAVEKMDMAGAAD